jgi:hypothetical protein
MVFVLMTALTGAAAGTEYAGGLMLGYYGGPSGFLQGTASELAPGFPMSLRLGLGYTSMDPGNAADARRIFINDATNGTPTQRGWSYNFRFDLIYSIESSFMRQLNVYGGPRHSRFTGNFNFIGGNEDFDVTSNQWGLGMGLEGLFPMGGQLALLVGGGFDYFFDSTLSGHDTAYSPDGEDVNARLDYTFNDADAAINQPGLVGSVMIGLNYYFGR